ncbi:MAG: SDR family oxidoreductase [bacterium]|nr:SDR family oxidoreductase [bacterium]
MARALARQGCKITLAARSADKLKALAEEIGPAALAMPTDLAVYDDIKQMVARTVAHFGRVDILFANAAVYIPGPASEADPLAWANMIDVNVTGVFQCAREVLPHMIEQKSGDILVTSSIAGHMELRGEPVYSASKHAIKTFVRTLRRQVCADGVRVGSIAPGTVATPIWDYAENDPRIAAAVEDRAVLRPEDIADISVFMLSQPRHVTIRDLVVLPQGQDI